MDILGHWETIQNNYLKNNKNIEKKEMPEYIIVFRYHIHIETNDSIDYLNTTEQRLWALECAHQIASGFLPIADTDAWELASVLLAVFYGPRESREDRFFVNGLLQLTKQTTKKSNKIFFFAYFTQICKQ